MKRFALRSLVLLSLVLSVAGCDTGTTTGEEKIVAEQYRGIFDYYGSGIVLTETTFRRRDTFSGDETPEIPAWTIGNNLYVGENTISEGTNITRHFRDNNTLIVVSTTGLVMEYKRIN